MVIQKKLAIVVLTLIMGLALSLFGAKKEYSVSGSDLKVCILTFETPFKQKLVDSLVKDLNSKKMSVTVDSISNSMAYNPADYHAVILLSEVIAFHPFEITSKFIKKYDYAKNIIYFSTYAKFNHPYGISLNKKKIDAITTATPSLDEKKIEEMKEKILSKIGK